MTDRAVKFIDENKDKPFFLYVAHWDVHGPHRALKEEEDKYKQKSQGWDNAANEKPNPVYAAMITAVDESVGRIRAKLRETGLDKNTIFIFSSDNGGTPVTTMEPLRGAKGALFEGGIRVSTCVTWPGVIKPGSSCDTPLTSVDILPTFAEIAGAQLPKNQPVDGRSFLPLLKGKKVLDERAIFWHYPLLPARQRRRQGQAGPRHDRALLARRTRHRHAQGRLEDLLLLRRQERRAL